MLRYFVLWFKYRPILLNNKKVLRELKRHIARCVASPWPGGGGGTYLRVSPFPCPGWGGYLPWLGVHTLGYPLPPVLVRGYLPWLGGTYLGVPPPPILARGGTYLGAPLPSILTWPRGYLPWLGVPTLGYPSPHPGQGEVPTLTRWVPTLGCPSLPS